MGYTGGCCPPLCWQAEWKSRWRELHDEMMAIVPKHELPPVVPAAGGAGTGAPATDGSAPAAATDAVALSDAVAAIIEEGEVKQAAAVEVKTREKLFTGDAVWVDGSKAGWLRYKGIVFGLPKGFWYGIEYEEAAG